MASVVIFLSLSCKGWDGQSGLGEGERVGNCDISRRDLARFAVARGKLRVHFLKIRLSHPKARKLLLTFKIFKYLEY